MKRVIIIQARMTSTRLPGKVLADLEGRPLLARQIERLRRCREADEIVIATTVNASDDSVVALADECGLRSYRGSENDVLSRYVEAARECRADAVVRITSDCPLIDAAVTDKVIGALTSGSDRCDYACNILERTYPRGLDVEALTMEALERCHREATTAEDREHVTSYIRRDRTGIFVCRSITDSADNSDLRWTVDTPSDLELVRRIYWELDLVNRQLTYNEILAFVRSRPDLVRFNLENKTWDPIEGESDRRN